MGERDWLTELTTALGDEVVAPAAGGDDQARADDGAAAAAAAASPSVPAAPVLAAVPPPDDDEIDLMGPGRSLEGWAEELAAAFAEDDEPPVADARHDDPAPVAAGAGTLDGTLDGTHDADPDADHDGLLRFDALVAGLAPAAPAVDHEAVAAAVDVAVAVAVADATAAVGAEVAAADQRVASAEARLARIESLLTADLAQLGPAVLTDSVGELEERLAAVVAGTEALAGRLAAIEVPEPADPADAAQPVAADPALHGALDELRGMVDRLTDRVAAQARFLAAHADTLSADAHQRDDLLRAVLARLDEIDRRL